MKKNGLPVAALLSLFIIISGFQYEVRAQSKWSGTLTLTQKFVGEVGKSDRHVEVSFTNALPTLHRNDPTTDLNFTDDKGTGTANFHSESVIGGKLIGTTDCRGSGQTELHEVVIDPEDSSLSIHAIGPACNGMSVSLLPGGTTQSYGPEFTDITVFSKASGGVNQTVLTGTETTVRDVVGMGKVTTTVSWSLWRGPIDAVLIVSPVNYNNWMPEATRDELRKGNSIFINLKVQKRNGGDSPFRVSRFELKLDSTSAEKGTTLNFPLNPPSNQLPDLRLLPDSIAESGEADQYIEINSTDGKTGYFSIGSYDGGGLTTLTAVAVLEGGIRIEGTLLTPTGVKEIPIPKRKANSKIASAWLATNGNPGERDDKETLPIKEGDGLTAYEEYRGVISKGEFRRLKPTEKELGVMATKENHDLFAEGVRWFENASGLTVVPFDETEIGADRRLNKNAFYANAYEQYVLKLENGPTTKGAAGENRPTNLSYMIPKQSELVVINVDWIDKFYHLQDSTASAEGRRMPYTRNEMLASTVAHELAHGVNVNHHGDPSRLPQNRTAYDDSHPPYHIFGTNGVEIPFQNWRYDSNLRKHYFEINGTVGETGNEESGDLSCFMAYTSLYNWSFRAGPAGSLNYYEVPLLPVGKKLCTAKIGTNDINSRPNSKYFGAAAVGKCMSQIKLRD
ncbi:MAG: hypothetical protein ABIR30_10540 [Chitinophagaceae bacterium]